MKNKLLSTITIFLFSISSYSQIEMGKIEKAKEIEIKTEIPKYESTEDFVSHSDYYKAKVTKILESGSGKNPWTEKECEKEEYYKRYNGLKVYYPSYPDNYKKEELIIFKKTDKIEIINRTQIGNKYFTIVSIISEFNKSGFFNDVINILGKDNNGGMLFELKDNTSNEIIYVVDSSYPKFILVPYFEKMKELINGKTFVAVSDFNTLRNPLSKTDSRVYIDKGTEWQGELVLLRKKDFIFEQSNDIEDEETVLTVLLNNEKEKALLSLKGDGWNFENSFISKSYLKAQKTANQNQNKLEENGLIKKYGEKFGKLVYQKKTTIGMSKDMCSDIYGITLNRKKIKNANGEIEVWEYTGILKLYFKNGKLSQIVNY